MQKKTARVAWLLPAMGTGGISFQHILSEFTKIFPDTITFTGQWPGYAPSFEDTFVVQEVGATRYVEFAKAKNGYTVGFSYASPQIIKRLWQFKPDIIFANAFTAWTLIALLLKPILRWQVIITYEGGSPIYEDPNSTVRHQARRLMARLADAFVVNGQAGKAYLLNILQVPSARIFARPFLVPSLKALLHDSSIEAPQLDDNIQRPVFLYVGQLISRKGLRILLEACLQLKQQGEQNFSLMIVGDGEQRSELESYVREVGLEPQVIWVGKVSYRMLGAYFQFADLFIFPTYDDIWGMVLTEAMAFGKPVICSTGAGAAEMVEVGKNGFIYDPNQVAELAAYLAALLKDPEQMQRMGARSAQIMLEHTPEKATECFVKAVEFVERRSFCDD